MKQRLEDSTSRRKKRLYKPSGAVLEVTFKSHQKPSINEVKAKWIKSCGNSLITRHITTSTQVYELLGGTRQKGKTGGRYSKSGTSNYFVETPDIDSHIVFVTWLGVCCVLMFF